MPDGGRAVADAAGVVGPVGGLEPGVEFGEGIDLRHRDAVGAPEPATLAFHAALLMRPLDAFLGSSRLSVNSASTVVWSRRGCGAVQHDAPAVVAFVAIATADTLDGLDRS